MAQSPTFAETRTSLHRVCEVAQRGLYELGKCRKSDTGEEQLMGLVLEVSKAILEALPCLQLECEAIEEADSLYCHTLNVLGTAEGEGGDPDSLPPG